MGRRKLSMQLIENKTKRMRTFSNRKQGLIKKASELSLLCYSQTALIIYDDDQTPHVWPHDPHKLDTILTRYSNTCVDQRRKKAQDMSSFLAVDKGKSPLLEPQVKHDHATNAPASDDDSFINGLSVDQLMGLSSYLGTKIELVESRIQMKKRSNLCQQEEEEEEWSMNMMMQPGYYQDYDELMMNDNTVGASSCNTNNVDGSGLMDSVVEDEMIDNGGSSRVDAKPLSSYRDPLELLNSNMPLFL